MKVEDATVAQKRMSRPFQSKYSAFAQHLWEEGQKVTYSSSFLRNAVFGINVFITTVGWPCALYFDFPSGETIWAFYGTQMTLVLMGYSIIAEEGIYNSRGVSFAVFWVMFWNLVASFIWQARHNYDMWGILPLFILFNGPFIIANLISFLTYGTKKQPRNVVTTVFIKYHRHKITDASEEWFLKGARYVGFQIFGIINGVLICEIDRAQVMYKNAYGMNATDVNATLSEVPSCRMEGLNTYILNLYFFVVYNVDYLCRGVGLASIREILSFSQAAAFPSRLFYGLILSSGLVFFLSVVLPNTDRIKWLMMGPHVVLGVIRDMFLQRLFKLFWFDPAKDTKARDYQKVYRRWSVVPGEKYNQYPNSWKRFTSSGPWGTVCFDNSGLKLKVVTAVDISVEPVAESDVEKEKYIETPKKSYATVIHHLNEGIIEWNYSYCYLMDETTGCYIRVYKISALKPDEDTTEGIIFTMQKDLDLLHERGKYMLETMRKDMSHSLKKKQNATTETTIKTMESMKMEITKLNETTASLQNIIHKSKNQ